MRSRADAARPGEPDALARLERSVALGPQESVDAGIELLEHESPRVVARACAVLADAGARRAVAPLKTLVNPRVEPRVAAAALRALATLGGDEVWRTFEAILENPDDPLHRPLLDELDAAGGPAALVECLKKNLFTHRYPFKARVLELFARYRGPTVEGLLREYLDESDETLAAHAARGLAHFPSPANYRRLADRAQLGPWPVQVACLEALLEIEDEPPTADLVPLLDAEHPEVVMRVLDVLERLGAAEAVPSIERVGRHSAWKVRERVARALGATRDPRVTDSLEVLTHDRRAPVRAAAYQGAAGLSTVDAETWGDKAADDSAATVRQVAPILLAEAGGQAARNRLFQLTQDVSAKVREAAIDALAAFELEGFEAMISPLTKDPDPKVKRKARELLVSLGAPADEVHLERALELADGGELPAARSMLRRLALDRPEDTKVLYELARLCRRLEDHGEAEAYLRQVLEERPDHVGARKHLAEALLEQDRRGEAAEHLREACAGDRTNWKLWARYGELALEQGQHRAAAGAFEAALDLHPAHLPARRGLAASLEARGDLSGARREWTVLHERDPADAEPVFALGRLYLADGEPEEAASFLGRAKELGRCDAELLRTLADALEALGDHRAALKTREEALATAPASPADRVAMARGYLECNDPERTLAVLGNLLTQVEASAEILDIQAQAQETMGELEPAVDTRLMQLGLDPDFPGASLAYAGLLRRLGRYDQARRAYRDHLDREPLDLPARRKLIELELLAGRSEASLTLLAEAQKQFPEDAGLHAQRARVLLNRGEASKALEPARAATRLDPHCGEHRVLLASVLLRSGSREAAREAFEHALELGADDPTLRMRIGRLHLEEDQPARALIHLERAAKTELVDAVELQLALGEALLRLERLDRARGWLAKARRPGDPRAHRLLAELELAHGDPRDALDHVRELGRIAPDEEGLARLEGQVRRRLGEPGAAMVQLERALEERPGDPDLVSELAACYVALGRHREVTELYPGSPLLPTDDPELRIAKATAHLALGNGAKAAALAGRMVELDPDLVPAHALRARALRGLGELPKAEEAVNRGLAIDPDHPSLLLERARLQLERGRIEGALVDAHRGLELPERDPEFFLVEARAHAAMDKPAEALSALANFILRAPERGEAYRLQAGLLRKLGRRDEAVEAYRNLLAHRPEDSEASLALADLYVELGRNKEAVAHLDEYLQGAGDRAPALTKLARIKERAGELEDAARYLRDLCEVQDGEHSRYKLLEVLLRRKDLGAAWPILERAAETYPELPRRLGDEMRDLGDMALAKDLYGYALSKDPHDVAAMAELAICQYRLGAYKPARRSFERVLARRPLHPQAHFYLGLLELLERRSASAQPHFEKALEGDPSNLTAHRHLAKIHLAAGHNQKALDAARLGLEHGRGDRELLLTAASACEALDHEEEALKAYRVAGRQVVDARSHPPAMRIALRKGRADLARQLGEEYHGARPEDLGGARLLATAAAADGDPARAADVLEGLWNLGEATVTDLRILGRAASACERYDLAAKAADGALTLEPGHAETWLLLGHVEVARGRAHDGVIAYRRARELQPKNAAAYRGEGEALLPQSRFREALAPAERAVQLGADDIRNQHLLGRVQRGLGNMQRAREALEMALSLPGGQGLKDRIRLELADVLRELGEAGNAQKVLESLPVSHGRDVARRIAEISFEAQDFAAAAHHAKAFLAQYPEEPGVLELLGRSLIQLGMDKRARACLDRHLTLFGTPEDLVAELAEVRIQRGQPGDAVHLLVGALEKAPESPGLWRALAHARRARRDSAGAARALERALEYAPSCGQTIRQLGELYLLEGESEKARALYGEALRREPYAVELLLGLGQALEAQGDFEKAAARYHDAAELSPGSALAHRQLGIALARVGQRERAVESLKRAVQADPQDVIARHALARAHRDRGQQALAEVHFRRLLELAAPTSREARAARDYLSRVSKAA